MQWQGRTLTLETGRLAKQAGGAVLVTYGETVVLVSATSSDPRPGIDFFPLTVDYEERLYAVGRIPGGFPRREGRATERAILAARLTDRPIRPLFPQGYRDEVQVIATVLSVDHDCPLEVCGILGASAALGLSPIPFQGPIAGVVVGLVDGQIVINPTMEQQGRSRLHLVVAGTRDAVIMIEAGASEVDEAIVLGAIDAGHREIQAMCQLQEQFFAEAGVVQTPFVAQASDTVLEAEVDRLLDDSYDQALRIAEKSARESAIKAADDRVQSELAQTHPDAHDAIAKVLKHRLKARMRQRILHEGVRPDGRAPDEIRPISCEVGLLPVTHGSGLFTRGQTQVLSICTLGPLDDAQILDDLGAEETKRYLHHYNFPPFSTGETKPLRAPSRRSIGHGALAERALEPMIPPVERFPYTLRVVSEVLESNGSTSMASVCGSTLALMDAGVPIGAPVAGIAMGLVKEGERVAVLSDIQGMEDALGDMDFKVAGTREGITAIQMDIKMGGLDRSILQDALEQARRGRMYILERMLAVIDRPRAEISARAPRVLTLQIDPERIREVIGPGGKTINRIIEETRVGSKKVDIDIEDDGTIRISSVNREAGDDALQRIRDLLRDVEPGQVYPGRVTRLMNFGAFVEILPGKEGLVHISQLSDHRVERVEDVVKVGDQLLVKVVEIDRQGRINLSHKAVMGQPASTADSR